MTKAQYFEMCKALGTEPKKSEIPIELEDLPTEVQVALAIWHNLRDDIDAFSGTFFGKDTQGILEIFDIYGIAKEDKKFMLDLIRRIDVLKTKEINAKKSSKQVKASPKG